jgi:ABC-type multidrug transport system ATPase subunit
MAMTYIELTNVTQRFGTVQALAQMSLTLERGETVGLVGPNGAGKTTTLRLLAGMLTPTEGKVRVDGRDPWQEPDLVRAQIGALIDRTGLYERLTIRENLALFASLFHQPKERVAEVIRLVGLGDREKRKVGRLSKGERQRTALARAILHQPECLFLDEPTAGLDPGARDDFHQALRTLQQEGRTIFLASHDLAEVESLCSRVALLDHGRILVEGSLPTLKDQFGHAGTAATLHEVYLRATGRVS